MTVESLLRSLGDEIEDAEEGKSLLISLLSNSSSIHSTFFSYSPPSFSPSSPPPTSLTPTPPFRILPPLLPTHPLPKLRLRRLVRHLNRPHNRRPRPHHPPIPHHPLLHPRGRDHRRRYALLPLHYHTTQLTHSSPLENHPPNRSLARLPQQPLHHTLNLHSHLYAPGTRLRNLRPHRPSALTQRRLLHTHRPVIRLKVATAEYHLQPPLYQDIQIHHHHHHQRLRKVEIKIKIQARCHASFCYDRGRRWRGRGGGLEYTD